MLKPWISSYRNRWVVAAMLWVLLAATGCGNGRLDVAPVHGRVMYGGQGVPRAIVVFHPSNPANEVAQKMKPFAYADNEGNFQLKTYVEGDGAPPGEYRVSIIARSTRAGRRPTKDDPVTDQASTTAGINIPTAISKKYSDVDTSGITVTVHEGENNLEPFVL